jgi:hypothetical protein
VAVETAFKDVSVRNVSNDIAVRFAYKEVSK